VYKKKWNGECMNKFKLLYVVLIAFCLFTPALLQGQVDTAWTRRYNGPGNSVDQAFSVAADGQGNVYVTGYSQSTSSASSEDYATIKYNSNGDTVWVRRYNGPGDHKDEARSLVVDGQGNVYVTGYSLGSGTYADYATIKYNSAGVQQWVSRYNGPPGNLDDYASSLAVDGQGNVYVTGQSIGSGTSYDCATVKYNSAGVQQWVQRYNGPGNDADGGFALAVDGQGNVYVTGYSDGHPHPDSINYDYATIKYNANGVQQWVQRYNGPGNSDDLAYFLALDGQANVHIAGSSIGSGSDIDYAIIKYNSLGIQQWIQRYNGPGNSSDYVNALILDGPGNVYVTGSSPSTSAYNTEDYATIKYNSLGAEQWVRRYNGPGNSSDKASSVAVDGPGNVYVTGVSRSTSSTNSEDYATIKYNSAGVQQWISRYNGPANGYDCANSLAVDGQGNVYVTGRSAGSGTNYDYATIKYVPTPGVEENRSPLSADRLSLEIFPNPAKTFFTIRLPLSADRSLVKIFDVSGTLVKEIASATPRNDNNIRVSLDGIKNGVYFIQVGNQVLKEKLVVTK
jgi:uncharacterized delta-60 repeat protein